MPCKPSTPTPPPSLVERVPAHPPLPTILCGRTKYTCGQHIISHVFMANSRRCCTREWQVGQHTLCSGVGAACNTSLHSEKGRGELLEAWVVGL